MPNTQDSVLEVDIAHNSGVSQGTREVSDAVRNKGVMKKDYRQTFKTLLLKVTQVFPSLVLCTSTAVFQHQEGPVHSGELKMPPTNRFQQE